MNTSRKLLSLIVFAGLVFMSLIRCSEPKFAEFSVDDVSKEMYFIDSTSASPNISHANVSVIITGEIDSSAIVTYASTNPENHGSGSYELKKGVINIKTQYDYYAGDTIWIKFIPKGAKKGHLKIRTRIN